MQNSRLFEIIYLLLDRKVMTAGELAKHFEVSPRTIYRDVEALSQAGIPIFAERGNGGGIQLTENYVLNKSVLSQEEQRSILASLHGMNALRPDDLRPVLDKLSAIFGGKSEDWIEIDFSSWNPANSIGDRFALLKNAILNRRLISFDYSSLKGGTVPRAAEPMKLSFRSGSWYLLAWCRLREDFRYFKLARMEALSVLEESFPPRPLPARKNSGEDSLPQAALTVMIGPEFSYRVRDEFAPEQWERLPDGSFRVRFQMAQTEWLYQYLLAYGPGLRVLEPAAVREGLLLRCKKILRLYEDGI